MWKNKPKSNIAVKTTKLMTKQNANTSSLALLASTLSKKIA